MYAWMYLMDLLECLIDLCLYLMDLLECLMDALYNTLYEALAVYRDR